MADRHGHYRGKRVLITGGLGMIGSTIARKLVREGAEVTLVDSCIEPYGANLFNVRDVRDSITVNISDIRDKESMKVLVRDRDIIFNLAGQVSHNDSLNDPYLDADINYIGHLNVLECLRRHNRDAVVLHAGSRLQFGRIERNPVDERHPLRPRTPYALNKTAAENTYQTELYTQRIFFEGTYTTSFSGNPTPTPRYDYNQIMYRLELDDPRLEAAHD